MLSRWTLLVGFLLSLALPALAQTLVYPVDVAVDPDGAVFVADHEAHALLKLEGGSFKTVAKGQGLPRTPLYGIRHIARAKDGKWVASDPATMKLYTIDGAGKVEPVADDERFVTLTEHNLRRYRSALQAHIEGLREFCHRHEIFYADASTEGGLEGVLTRELPHLGLLGWR